MLIYFDESYDDQHKYLLLSALFNPHPKFLHRKITEIKRKYNFIRQDGTLYEIKYNYCKTSKYYDIAKEVIDTFFESTSWFRCIAINQTNFDLNYFGRLNEPEKIKKARAYKKFAELLIAHNTEKTYMGVLLTDKLTRCKKDEFVEIMKNIFCIPDYGYSVGKKAPTLVRIEEVSSYLEQYQVLQVCDLLMGCVLNNLFPTKNKFKNLIREYLIKKLKVKDLLPETWNRYSKTYVEEYFPKFNIWYWKPK